MISKKQRKAFADAFRDFDAAFDLVNSDESALIELGPDQDGVADRLARIAKVKTSVAGVKSAIGQLGSIYQTAAPAFGGVSLMVPKYVLMTIKGGTTALLAIHYETQQFIKSANGQAIPQGAYAQLAEWGILGAMSGVIENLRG